MSKIVGIDKNKKQEPVCKHCGKVPESEHPRYSCPRLERVQELDDGIIYEYVQTHSVEVTHRVTSEPAPQGADDEDNSP
jgi:hypothetical protein